LNASNRSLTLDGANKVFGAIGISIAKDPLNFYFSAGLIEAKNATLTGLCQQLVVELASNYRS